MRVREVIKAYQKRDSKKGLAAKPIDTALKIAYTSCNHSYIFRFWETVCLRCAGPNIAALET